MPIETRTIYKVDSRQFDTYLEAQREERIQQVLSCCYGYRDFLINESGSTNARLLVDRLLDNWDIIPKEKKC